MSEHDIDRVLTGQWAVLRDWLAVPVAIDSLDQASILDGWTVRDLIAHLGRSFTTISAAIPANGVAPLSLYGYVTGYAAGADEIAEGTRSLAVEFGIDLLPSVDKLASEGIAALRTLDAPVVRGPRGPIRRDDFVVTRIIELVVHADDLARSIGDESERMLEPSAVRTVADALADGYRDKTGATAIGATGLGWIRAATGRMPSDDPALPLF